MRFRILQKTLKIETTEKEPKLKEVFSQFINIQNEKTEAVQEAETRWSERVNKPRTGRSRTEQQKNKRIWSTVTKALPPTCPTSQAVCSDKNKIVRSRTFSSSFLRPKTFTKQTNTANATWKLKSQFTLHCRQAVRLRRHPIHALN